MILQKWDGNTKHDSGNTACIGYCMEWFKSGCEISAMPDGVKDHRNLPSQNVALRKTQVLWNFLGESLYQTGQIPKPEQFVHKLRELYPGIIHGDRVFEIQDHKDLVRRIERGWLWQLLWWSETGTNATGAGGHIVAINLSKRLYFDSNEGVHSFPNSSPAQFGEAVKKLFIGNWTAGRKVFMVYLFLKGVKL